MLLQQCHCVHSLSLQAQALDEWIVCTVVQTAQSLLPQKRKQPGRGANSRQIMCISAYHHINLDVHYYTIHIILDDKTHERLKEATSPALNRLRRSKVARNTPNTRGEKKGQFKWSKPKHVKSAVPPWCLSFIHIYPLVI